MSFIIKTLIVFAVLTSLVMAGEEAIQARTIYAPASGALSWENPFVWGVQIGGVSDEAMYRDPVGGFFPWRQLFWNSVSLSIENQGDADIHSPWVTVEGGPNAFSLPALLKSLIPPGASESEKAWAIYDYTRTHVFHEVEGTGDNADPIKLYNCYGHGICGDSATALSAMWAGAGLRVRAGRPLGHSTSEVQVDGAFRLLDGDLHAWVLKADNHTLAGEEDIVSDPYLLKRTHTYGLKQWAWDPLRDEFAAGLYWYRGDRLRSHQSGAKHTMAMTLRPHEKITWLWEQRLAPLPDFAPRIPGNGPLRDIAGKWFQGIWEYPWQSSDGSKQLIPFRLPYPIVGCKVEGLDARNAISASVDGKTFHPLNREALDEGIREKSLLEALGRKPSDPPIYSLVFEVSGSPAKLRFLLDFQVAPLSLPMVHLGENRFAYIDRSKSRKVQITYRWRENHENHPPAAPEPENPTPGGTVSGNPIEFRWKTPMDPDGDAISDYQFQLSESSESFRPLSPNFDALLSFTPDRETTRFILPHPGLLNGGATYFWRVRARDAKDCWGSWGGPWPVTVAGPPTPRLESAVVDQSGRTLHLKWSGKAEKYRVFGGFHRGFVPSDQPHKILSAKGGGEPDAFQQEPSNMLVETEATELRIPFEGAGSEHLRPFYRIQAVDAHGISGAWSEQIEIPGPILLSPNPMTLPPGQTVVPLDFLGAKGHLVNLSNEYHERIAHPDTWIITAVESDAPIHAEGDTLFLERPPRAGERMVCRLQIRGSGYFNRERQAGIELTLIGGGEGTPPEQTKVPAMPSAPGSLTFDAVLKSPWNISPQNAQFNMCPESDGSYLVVTASDETKPWSATLTASLPESPRADEDGNIPWGASLMLDTGSWQAGYELTLRASADRWVTVILNPWFPIQIRDSDGSRAASTEPFAPVYGRSLRLRVLTDTRDGGTRVQIGDHVICQMPGKSPFSPQADSALQVQLIAREPTSGSLSIGNIMAGAASADGLP